MTLIHGGLRYLEFYEFLLVRKALGEREVLWALAPHIIQPMRLVLPHQKGLRPAWLLRLGLFVYDHIGGRKNLPVTRTLDLTVDIAGKPLKPLFTKGFEFSDCRVDDSRLVVLNAIDAAERQAVAEQLSACFHLDGEETDALIEAARTTVEDSTQLYPFTRVITDRFSDTERIRMIEMLWSVAYADGRLHDYEASLVRRVAGLIYVADRDNGAARKRVLRRLGLATTDDAPAPAGAGH